MDDDPIPVPEKPEEVKKGGDEAKGPPPVPGEGNGEKAGPGLHEVVWAHAKLFSRRIVRSNFLGDGVSEEEKEALDEVGVTTPMSQNYLAWRRALLWFGAVTLGISVLFGMVSHFSGFGDSPGIIQLVIILLFLAEAGACALGVMAAMRWTEISQTRKLARFSWLALFVVPFVLFLIPVMPFVSGGQAGMANPQQALGVSAGVGLLYAFLLAPKLIGLFPALIRSSLTLKTLLPESPMPGWIAVVISPLYALFFVVLLVIAMQLGNFLLILSLAALAAAPIMIAMNVNRLVQPCSEEEALVNISHVRKRIGIANLVGLGAGLIYGIQLMQMAPDVGFFDLALFLCSIFAMVFLLTVVVSDLMIGVFKAAFLRENALREGPLADELGKRFADLDSRGLTALLAGEGELLKSVKGKFSGGGETADDGGGEAKEKAGGETDEKKEG